MSSRRFLWLLACALIGFMWGLMVLDWLVKPVQ